jgi:thiol-disulfide isomerase/thioredoxin
MNRLHATSSRLVHSWRIFGAGACLLASLVGCSNSFHVIRTNVARSAQSGGKPQPKAWPAHPYVQETAARPTEVSGAAAEAPQDAEEDEVQTAQWQPTAQPVRASAAGSVISGRVIDVSGRPQGFVSIVASPLRRPGGSRVETTTDSQGNFMLRGLESGQRYLILASATRSPIALIGRVSATAPQQGITIGLSRPYTSDRQAPPATERHDPESDYVPPPRSTRDNANGSNGHSSDPFTPSPGAASAPKQGTRPTTPTQARDDIAANNRMQSPWDMPAPPTQRTPQIPPRDMSTPRAGQPTPSGSASDWRAAGSKRSEPSTPAKTGGPSLLEAAPPKSQPLASNGGDPKGTNNSRIAPPGSPGGRASDSEADAPPERPRATVTSAKPKSEALNVAPTAHPTKGSLHPRSMCQMDGHRLVDFQLKDVEGQPVSFQSTDARLVLLDFWQTSCLPCRRGMPNLMNLQKRYGSQGLQVIGIACEQGPISERAARVAKIRNQLHVPYPLLLDEGSDKLLVRDHFGVDAFPTLILLDRSGKVLWRSEGPDQADLARLENLLKSQLNSSAIRYN